MAVWMELHCDVQVSESCASFHGNSVSDRLSWNAQESIWAEMKRLKDIARRRGWKVSQREIACPACKDLSHEDRKP